MPYREKESVCFKGGVFDNELWNVCVLFDVCVHKVKSCRDPRKIMLVCVFLPLTFLTFIVVKVCSALICLKFVTKN